MNIGNDVRNDLISAARAVQRHAHAPYSHFPVGAALRAAGGKTFVGCNVENASFGLTICAERAVVAAAIATGESQFELMVVASPGGVPPCGACRQVLAEFNSEIPILLIDTSRETAVVEVSLVDLFPQAFRLPESSR